jgi:hypothetical protein
MAHRQSPSAYTAPTVREVVRKVGLHKIIKPRRTMKTEDLLMLVIVGGFALSVCYVASEVVSFKALKAMDLAALLRAHDLYKKLHAVTKPLKPLIIKVLTRRK